MNFLRKILFPFALFYGFITSIRNFCYDNGLFKSYSFDIPIIAVGNLSVGGTGKTPQIEYLIRLLSDDYKVATLSRGYKRKSSGFILADEKVNATILGDEPFQMFQKFPTIKVAVDADRKNGIEQLLLQDTKTEVILLDDAFQHRKVKAGFYIMLTAFNDLFTDDFLLPTGNLRESRQGYKRANCIVVTKCPKDISDTARDKIKSKIAPKSGQKLYFSYIDFDEKVYAENGEKRVVDVKASKKVIIAGIAKPKTFFNYLQESNDVVMSFPDHHFFTDVDIENIKEKAGSKIIITTEKDFVRLKGKLPADQLFYLPIRSQFLRNQEDFNKTILDYVGKSSRNSSIH